jgi:RNA polymerase sigma factor (sigma-70 family)
MLKNGTAREAAMNANPLRRLLSHLRAATGPGSDEVPDAELLDRFFTGNDAAAFELLVWRHAGRVLALCQRVVGDRHEAEDAVQATFLVLARKGASIGKGTSLGSWLFKVAYRIALDARHKRARTVAGAGCPRVRLSADPAREAADRELACVLDEEVDRLPEKLRAAFLLCHAEGKTNEQAAREIGCPVGTLVSRLARARERLRLRLARRGFGRDGTLPALPVAGGVAELVSGTTQAALQFAATGALAGVVPAGVAELTRRALRPMLLNKLRACAVALAVAACLVMAGPYLVPTQAAPAPAQKGKVEGGVVVLDDGDPDYDRKERYDDGLTFLSGSGKFRTRVSGLNVCEEIGSPNRVAIDAVRKRVWVAETVGRRLLQYDLDGKEQAALRDVGASAVAVDSATGNVWVAWPGGRAQSCIKVYDPTGKEYLTTHQVEAYDLTYDAKSKAMWVVDKEIAKVSLDGKVLVRKVVADWFAVSVAVNPTTGDVWTVSRRYSKDLGKNVLLGFDSDGKLRHTIPLGEEAIPFRVAVNPRDGSVWVANWGKSLLHYDAKGKRLGEHKLAALTVAVNSSNDNVWVVTGTEILDVDPKGKVVGRTGLRAKTTQAWIASY